MLRCTKTIAPQRQAVSSLVAERSMHQGLESAMDSPHWPGTPVPDTAEWVTRCLAEFSLLDSSLDADDSRVLVMDMSTERHWRHFEPEAAAQALFGPGKLYSGW